ncbi:MAG: hypothetical protein Q8R02_03655 [Hyphomonadaceae bacterium]|nr:hypothetical protein [Hyphomonadaceae bacterium]
MTRVSSLILLTAAAIALASPALAKTTLQKGQNVCKEELAKAQPAYKSVRIDKEGAKVNGETFVFDVRVKNADDSAAKLLCTVDRESLAVTIAAPAS